MARSACPAMARVNASVAKTLTVSDVSNAKKVTTTSPLARVAIVIRPA